MLLEKQRRRMRLALQMSITYRAWFGLLFYPISFLLLLDKLQINRGADATASLANVLHAAAFFLLLLADVARYYLGTAGNLRRQVFQLSAFLFLSVCPVLPALLYLCFSSEFRLPFDMVTGSMLLAFVSAEFAFGWVVLRDLLRQETARFMRLQSEEDSDDDGNGEREQAKTNDSY